MLNWCPFPKIAIVSLGNVKKNEISVYEKSSTAGFGIVAK